MDGLYADVDILFLHIFECTDVFEEEFEGQYSSSLVFAEIVHDALALDGPVVLVLVQRFRPLVDAKDHGHDVGHFIGGFVELHGSLVGIQQVDKSFRALKQLEVVLYCDHEEFVDVDIDHLHGSKDLEGGIEYFIDKDEQLGSYEYSYFL